MELWVTDDEAGGEDRMVGRDGRIEQMPSERLKGSQRASFLSCKYFNPVLRRRVHMRLVQSQESAAETAPGLKLEILGVGHSDVFLLHL